jgi:tetratricopeptide (TPR) repeat protein
VPSGAVVASGIVQRLRYLTDSASRQHIWRAAWRLFREHPVVGTGLDTFQIAFADQRTAAYWNIEWNASPTRAHNEALNLLATQGVLGGVAVLVLAVGVLVAIRRALRATDDRLLAVALAAGVAAFAVQDLFSFTVAGCGTLVVTQAALLSRLGQRGDEPAEPDRVESLLIALAVAVVVAVAVFAHNVAAAPLLDEPARVVGGLVALVALLAGAGAAGALEQHGRPLAFGGPPRAAPPRTGAARAALAARWLVGAALLVLLVLRPLAAARAAYQGILLTPDAPAMAVARLREAVWLDPYMELYWVKLGSASQASAHATRDAAERRRALDEARAAYARAIRLVPANSYNYANLGRVMADLARDGGVTPAEAFAAFDRALALDPNNAYFYADAANAGLVVGDVERARQYAARGAALYPRFALLQAQLGHVAMLRQRPAEAAPLLQAALDGDWHGAERVRGGTASNLAAAWLQLGKPAQAETAARLAVTLAPTAVEARFNLGKALEVQGRRVEAIEEYRRALAQQPGYEPARAALRALGG